MASILARQSMVDPATAPVCWKSPAHLRKGGRADAITLPLTTPPFLAENYQLRRGCEAAPPPSAITYLIAVAAGQARPALTLISADG